MNIPYIALITASMLVSALESLMFVPPPSGSPLFPTEQKLKDFQIYASSYTKSIIIYFYARL